MTTRTNIARDAEALLLAVNDGAPAREVKSLSSALAEDARETTGRRAQEARGGRSPFAERIANARATAASLSAVQEHGDRAPRHEERA